MTIKKCLECGDDSFHFDPFGFGNLLDEHEDSEVDESEMGKRIAEAIEMNRKFGGRNPIGIEEELEDLIKPKLTWQDFTRAIKVRKKQDNRKNDWSNPKRRPLFAGLYIPKKIDYTIKFLLAYDCSGSMSKKQISYGVSQILSLSDRGSGFCVPWEYGPYWEAMTKLNSATPDQLRNAKYKGGGGTVLAPLFETYEKHTGNVDIIFVVSDFGLADTTNVMKLQKPANTEVIWLSVNPNNKFNPPFGKLFELEVI